MTANIEVLMRSPGKPYQAIRDARIIMYKTPPKGTQCDPSLTLDMKKESIFLSFDNDSLRALSEISLELKSGRKDGAYPDELPIPLKPERFTETTSGRLPEKFTLIKKFIQPTISASGRQGHLPEDASPATFH